MKFIPHFVIACFCFFIHTYGFANYFSLPLNCTESGCMITSYFDNGGVKDWNCQNNTYSGHHGTDIAPYGGASVDVYAAADGKVVEVLDGLFDACNGNASDGPCCNQSTEPCGWGFGNHVRVQHDNGLLAIYGHMKKNSIRVNVGDQIKCGDLIGNVASSGWSSGPHLHFEVRDGSGGFDPYKGQCGNSKSYWISQGNYEGLPSLTCDTDTSQQPEEPEPEEPEPEEPNDNNSSNSTGNGNKPKPEPEPEPTRPGYAEPINTDYNYNAALFYPVGGESSANNTNIRLGFGYQIDLLLLFENTSDTDFNDIDHVTLKKESGESPFAKDEFPMIKKDIAGTFSFTIRPHDIFRYEISMKAGNTSQRFQSVWRNHHGSKGFFGQAVSFDISFETPIDDAVPMLDRDMANGYAVAPSEKVLKRFKYQNAGNIPWQGFDNVYALKHIQGEDFGVVNPIPLTKTATIIPSDNVTFSSYLQVPDKEGDYRGSFGLFYNDSLVGDVYDVHLRVIADPNKRKTANEALLGHVITYSKKYQMPTSQNNHGITPKVTGFCACSQKEEKKNSLLYVAVLILLFLERKKIGVVK